MKAFTKKHSKILLAVLIACFAGIAIGADLDYNTLVPQTGDTELVITHKAELTAAPKLYKNIAATGTTSLTSVSLLDRVVVGTAGGTNTSIVITDGTNAVATLSGSNQATVVFNTVVTTGTLNIVVSGTAPNLTVGYR